MSCAISPQCISTPSYPRIWIQEKDIGLVVKCIIAFGREIKKSCPDFKGPHLHIGSDMAPVRFLLFPSFLPPLTLFRSPQPPINVTKLEQEMQTVFRTPEVHWSAPASVGRAPLSPSLSARPTASLAPASAPAPGPASTPAPAPAPAVISEGVGSITAGLQKSTRTGGCPARSPSRRHRPRRRDHPRRSSPHPPLQSSPPPPSRRCLAPGHFCGRLSSSCRPRRRQRTKWRHQRHRHRQRQRQRLRQRQRRPAPHTHRRRLRRPTHQRLRPPPPLPPPPFTWRWSIRRPRPPPLPVRPPRPRATSSAHGPARPTRPSTRSARRWNVQ